LGCCHRGRCRFWNARDPLLYPGLTRRVFRPPSLTYIFQETDEFFCFLPRGAEPVS
jgi:hypothetical protein